MDVKLMTIEQVETLSSEAKNWLLEVMYEEGMEIEGNDLTEVFEEFNEEYFEVFYHKGDINGERFEFNQEGGVVIVEGNIDVKTMALYGITNLLVIGNITAQNVVTQDSCAEIIGNITTISNFILSDTSTSLEVLGKLTTPSLISTIVGDEKDAELIKVKEWSVLEVNVTENSYSQMGSKKILKRLGFKEVNLISRDNMDSIWKNIY